MMVMNDKRKYWLDEPRNVTKIVWALAAVCALLFVADAFYEKHPYFAAEEWFGFYGGFGFVMCIGLVLGAKWMRKAIKRDEDYYDRQP
jgi:hypothetical protein